MSVLEFFFFFLFSFFIFSLYLLSTLLPCSFLFPPLPPPSVPRTPSRVSPYIRYSPPPRIRLYHLSIYLPTGLHIPIPLCPSLSSRVLSASIYSLDDLFLSVRLLYHLIWYGMVWYGLICAVRSRVTLLPTDPPRRTWAWYRYRYRYLYVQYLG